MDWSMFDFTEMSSFASRELQNRMEEAQEQLRHTALVMGESTEAMANNLHSAVAHMLHMNDDKPKNTDVSLDVSSSENVSKFLFE